MRHKALLFNKTSSNKDDVFSITTNAPCGCTNYGCFRSKHCALVIVFVTLSIASFSRNAFVLRPVMFPTRQSPVSHEHPQIEFRVVKDNCSNNKNSTELLHHSTDRMFYGPFSHLRAGLDYNYHKNFNEQRQNVQDQILIHFLQKQMQQQQQQGESSMDSAQGSNSSDCTSEIKRPILVFTAGCMGSGKTHTLHALYHQGRFPLTQFLTVDPDEIRRHLPEFSEFVQCHPELAGHLTRKEAGYISELLTLAALERQHNVVIDGSLRDSGWYVVYFSKMRALYPTLYIAILHILAPRDVVYQRAKERAMVTGRVVPEETLEAAFKQVPESIKILRPLCDFFCELNNLPHQDIELVTEGLDWDTFANEWSQFTSSTTNSVNCIS